MWQLNLRESTPGITIPPATSLFQAPRQSGPLNWESASTKIKREKTGRGEDSVPSFFLFPAPPTFCTPFFRVFPTLSEILEQANQLQLAATRTQAKSRTIGMLEETCQWVKWLRSNSARDLTASKHFEYGIKNYGTHDGGLRMLIYFEKVFCILTISYISWPITLPNLELPDISIVSEY